MIILDVRRPGNGFGVLDHVRSSGPSPPVLMLTADRGARDRGLRAGADAFVQKPFDNAELVSTVGELLASAA
ncbi:MAG TPA: response regulator [Solirubrobacteraceae bacterium]